MVKVVPPLKKSIYDKNNYSKERFTDTNTSFYIHRYSTTVLYVNHSFQPLVWQKILIACKY